MHIHTDTRWLNGGWPVSPLNLFLANGVTTIRDFGPKGTPTDHALYWREEVKNGRLRGPAIYAAGPILYGPVENAKKSVLDQKKKGFDFVKLYSIGVTCVSIYFCSVLMSLAGRQITLYLSLYLS